MPKHYYHRKTDRIYGAATAFILQKAAALPEISWRDLCPPLDPASAKTRLWQLTRQGLLIKTRPGRSEWFKPPIPSLYKLNPGPRPSPARPGRPPRNPEKQPA